MAAGATPDDADLKQRVERLEAVQSAILRVGQLSCNAETLPQFLAAVHQAVGSLMYAANFFIALYDASDCSLRFAYAIDEFDSPLDPAQSYALRSADESPTAWVILKRAALNMTAAEDSRWPSRNSPWHTGTPARHWIGVPLLGSEQDALGAMVIQSYDDRRRYSDEDAALFGLMASHVANALERMRTDQRLQAAFQQRRQQLEHELAERREAEALQLGLYEIAALSSSDASLEQVYYTVHEVTARLLYARNFFILLHHAESDEISFPYFVDQFDRPPPPDMRLPVWQGITSYVVRTRTPQLIDAERFQALLLCGEIQSARGHLGFVSWIGAPMIAGDKLFGVIAVQSYEPAVRYSQPDLDLLAYMASHVAGALDRRESDAKLREAADNLSRRNDKLASALQQLHQTQDELARKAKLASLGGLVAGIAHEINTPLGICVTAASHLQVQLRSWRARHKSGALDAAAIEAMFNELTLGLDMLDSNTRRGAELVRSFKQVAVDQSSGDRRVFQLDEYLDEILLALKPRLKQSRCTVNLQCKKGIRVDSYPGALSQALTQLVGNAASHAYEGRPAGEIRILAQAEGDHVVLQIADDGIGMGADELARLFDPFYTTKRGSGASGLGAHIAFNQVTARLGGTIRAHCEPGAGLRVEMRFPRSPTDR